VFILFLNNDGTVKSFTEISDGVGGFGGDLDPLDAFGFSLHRVIPEVTSGIANIVLPGSYTVSEVLNEFYTSTITGDCASDGTITVTAGQNAVCTITNTFINQHSSSCSRGFSCNL